MLQALSAAASEVGVRAAERRTLRLGLFCFSSCYFLGSLLTELGSLHPGVELTLVGAATDQPLVALDEGAADLVVVPEPLGASRLPRVPLGWVDDVAVVRRDGWSSDRTLIRAHDFEEQMLICHRFPSGSWKDEYRLPFEIVPAGVLAVAFTDVLVHLVRSGGGVAIVPRWVIELHPSRPDLISLRIGPRGVRRRWYLFLAPGLTEDLVVNDVREILARHLGATAD